MAQQFVLVQHGDAIDLAKIERSPDIKVGFRFDRMPVLTVQSWQVIRLFTFEESAQLEALSILMGAGWLNNIFAATISIEECTRSPDQG